MVWIWGGGETAAPVEVDTAPAVSAPAEVSCPKCNAAPPPPPPPHPVGMPGLTTRALRALYLFPPYYRLPGLYTRKTTAKRRKKKKSSSRKKK